MMMIALFYSLLIAFTISATIIFVKSYGDTPVGKSFLYFTTLTIGIFNLIVFLPYVINAVVTEVMRIQGFLQ